MLVKMAPIDINCGHLLFLISNLFYEKQPKHNIHCDIQVKKSIFMLFHMIASSKILDYKGGHFKKECVKWVYLYHI